MELVLQKEYYGNLLTKTNLLNTTFMNLGDKIFSLIS